MFFTPILYLTGVLLVWILLGIAERNTTRQLMNTRWRTLLGRIAIAALALSVLYASPFGPARDLKSAMRWFAFGYPPWLLLSIIWLLPGVAASKRLALNPLWVLPSLALVIDLSVEGFQHWPRITFYTVQTSRIGGMVSLRCPTAGISIGVPSISRNEENSWDIEATPRAVGSWNSMAWGKPLPGAS